MPADESPDGYLLDLYRQYIGEPDDETDVYVGFGLFIGGILLAVVALLLFLWASQYPARTYELAAWMEPAIALGMISLPALMLGIVVLLPSEQRVLYTSIAGSAIIILAVGGFLYAYPDDWWGFGNDYTVEVVAVYAVGLAGITASTGAALIAHYLELASYVEYVERPPAEDEEKEHYTDEEIRADIDAAMEDVEFTWGGIQRTETSRLEFTGDEFDEVSVDMEAKTVRTSGGVDQQVAGLKGLKGGEAEMKTASGSTVDDQTAKLSELRKQQQAEDLATATETKSSPVESMTSSATGIIDRIKSFFSR